MTKTNLNTKIDSLINQKKSFALWRIPGETCIHYAIQTKESPSLLYDIESLNGRSGFVIAPFNISDAHPIVLISPEDTGYIEIEEISDNCDLHSNPSGYSFVSEEKDIRKTKCAPAKNESQKPYPAHSDADQRNGTIEGKRTQTGRTTHL